ncbi:MAG: class I SAM-dependent methyltransferase [Kiritimatiellia bacterium]
MRPGWEFLFAEPPRLAASETGPDGDVRSGEWIFADRRVPVENGVPRFVENQDYASNFGRQWTDFRLTQLDSHTGLPLTFNRFWNNTRWNPGDLRGRLVLEAGSGAGRFTEILAASGARVVSFDLSRAVDANHGANGGSPDLLLCQASIYEMPFRPGIFDYVFCHGVLQHTPDPDRSYRELFRMLKPGGRISIDYYLKLDHVSEWTTPKYLWRPVTATMDPDRLLAIIKTYMPLWLPVDSFLRRIPGAGPWLRALCGVPCWSYPELPLSREEKLSWAIMDTFDALGARYDLPKTREEVRRMMDLPGTTDLEVVYGGNGVVANARKRPDAPAGETA